MSFKLFMGIVIKKQGVERLYRSLKFYHLLQKLKLYLFQEIFYLKSKLYQFSTKDALKVLNRN